MASSTCSAAAGAILRAGVFAACCAVAASAVAQPPAADVHTVTGRVLRPSERGLVPVRDEWVVLHRLGSDGAGPLDSTRTDTRGAYRFRYVPSGEENAMYFAAVVYSGVAYFTAPLGHSVAGEAAEIVVYDTTTQDIPIGVRGRHIIVSAVDAQQRRPVMEVYELSNDTTLTRVSPSPQSEPTWRTPIPTSARDVRVAAGDVPAEAVTFSAGEVRLVTPIAPGVKQLAYSYTLPTADFPLSIPLTSGVDLLEILIEEDRGTATGARLSEVEPVTVEGRRFRRFLAQDVPAGAVAVVDVTRATHGVERGYILGVVLLAAAAMVLVLARTLRRA